MRRRGLVFLLVICALFLTGQVTEAARTIIDSTPDNFVVANSGQYFDNRNNGSGMPSFINTSKGDYFTLDVMIQINGSLASFDDIIEITATTSAYPKLIFPLFRWEGCPYFLTNQWQDYYLHLRYSPAYHTSTWTYTLRYYDKKRNTHIQTFSQPGPPSYAKLSPIAEVLFNSTNNTLSWAGVGDPSTDASANHKLRIYDASGCIIAERSTYDLYNGYVSFAVGDLRGKLVRAENRRILDTSYVYRLKARSIYHYQIPQ